MYARETAQGKWRFAERFRDPLTGKTREVSVTLAKNTNASRKEASMILREKIAQMGPAPTDRLRLGELISKFVTYQYTQYKESTAIQDEMHLRSVQRLIGSDALVPRITTETITKALEKEGKNNTWKNQKIRHIKLLWRWAYKKGYIESLAVIDRLERYPEPSARQKVIEKYMESDELREVLADICNDSTDYGLLTHTLALSGLRIGEAIALTVNDIDFDNKEIIVNKTYAVNARKIQSTKTEMSDRVIYMRPELLELMRKVVYRQKQMQVAYGIRTNLLFPWSDGGFMHYEAYSKFFRNHTKKVLGHPFQVHSLRHTFTSLMAEAGVPIEIISRQLGHADSKVTKDIYMHVTDKIKKADNERLASVKIL